MDKQFWDNIEKSYPGWKPNNYMPIRLQIAAMAMHGLLSKETNIYGPVPAASRALEYADELIRQFNETEK